MEENKRPSVMNLPNTLSLLRMVLVPFFVWSVLAFDVGSTRGCLIPAAIFAVTSFTDFLDGQIARRCNLITDFGKFLDPLADKFMVFSACLVLTFRYTHLAPWILWASVIIMFRDLAVTSLRLVAAGKSGIVIAASIWGKLKTVSHIVGILCILLEPMLLPLYGRETYPISYTMLAVMAASALFSGIDYLRAYLPALGFGRDKT